MTELLSLLFILPLLGFWLWMFWEMSHNTSIPNSPTIPLSWPPQSKLGWSVAFILLNVVAAGFYYFTIYREQ